MKFVQFFQFRKLSLCQPYAQPGLFSIIQYVQHFSGMVRRRAKEGGEHMRILKAFCAIVFPRSQRQFHQEFQDSFLLMGEVWCDDERVYLTDLLTLIKQVFCCFFFLLWDDLRFLFGRRAGERP